MLRGALREHVDATDFEVAGIAPTARAEELDVDAWVAERVAADGDAPATRRVATFYRDLERLELALFDREPYRRIGIFWQLVASKPSP